MITEDYVSFETAKLLKEKGFKGLCTAYYDCFTTKNFHDGGEPTDYNSIDPKIRDIIAAPTLQMAMKWLREVHNIYIDISPTYSEVEKTIHYIWQIFDSNYDDIGDCEIFYSKYETACEEAIKYCLENLI